MSEHSGDPVPQPGKPTMDLLHPELRGLGEMLFSDRSRIKREACAELMAKRKSDRKQRRIEWRCFWTRPFGHKYKREGIGFFCVCCDKEADW